ncbi:hypothetical protein P7C70_g7837, partial [Phenoliferia sp. Uapishka_3]
MSDIALSRLDALGLDSQSECGSHATAPNYAPSATTGASIAALPPVDRGRDAYLFLAAATTIEILMWGLPFSVGVLHSYWITELFPAGTSGLGILTVASTLQYCSAVVLGPLLIRYPQHRLRMQQGGLVISVASLLLSAFATKPWHLLISIGLLYPFSALLYYPAPTLLFQWFQAKGGLASGIMYSGTGAGGTVFPFILQGLISRLGYRGGLIGLAIGYGILGAISLPFIKPRIPLPPKNSMDARRARQIDRAIFKRSTFWAFSGCILLSSFGNFVPSIFVPSFALDLNLTQNDGTLLIAVMNAASVPGLLALGWLSDRYPPRILITLSCTGSALACFFLWGFAKNIELLSVFVIVFGALGLSFTALWTKLISVIVRDDPNGAMAVFAVFAFARGCGNIASGPISSVLLANNQLAGGKGGYGVTDYGSLLLYTGLTLVAGSFVGVMYRDSPKPNT